jgi:hypothetical protein
MRTGVNPYESVHGEDDGKQCRRRMLYVLVFADDSEKDTIRDRVEYLEFRWI